MERKFVLGRLLVVMVYYCRNIGTLVEDVKEQKIT
jgi:hypothetical protein